MSHHIKPYSSSRTNSGRTLRNSKWKFLNISIDEEVPYDVDNEPLLLVSFKNYRSTKMKMKIVDETLQHILKSTGSLPLCIINITGPANLGKSFLINFVLRKLEAMESNEKNWMGWGQHELKLNGFPLRNDRDIGAGKEGIRVWPRPFTIETNEGKMAVLVMETNGLHDESYDSAKALTSIFCLCLLTSSILIYNTSEDNITEDSFMPWIPYLRFGKSIIKNAEPCQETPFQTLSVLIRDWRNANEYSHGNSQGKSFLSKQLQEHLDYKNGKHFSKALKKYFLKADCSFLPPMDHPLPNNNLNTGKQMGLKFAKTIEQYVNGLLSVENLHTKQIGGTVINSKMFGNLLNSYVSMINAFNKGSATISGDNLYKISKSTLNACMIDDAVDTYKFVMENETKTTSYITNMALQRMHKIAKHDAEHCLKKAFLRKNSNDLIECRKILSTKIAESFKTLQRKNEKLREDILFRDLEELLSKCRDSLYQQTLINDDTDSCEENLKSATNEKLADIKRQLYVNFPQEDEEGIDKLVDILREKVSQSIETLPEKKKFDRKIQNFRNNSSEDMNVIWQI